MDKKDYLKGRPERLERWMGERRDRHRGLLLWAMQSPYERSMRAVARAMGKSEGTIRNWRAQGCWELRAKGHEESVDQDALDLYRAEYMADFGTIELPHVARYIVRTLGAIDLNDPAAQAAHDARVRTANAIPKAKKEVEQATAQAVAENKRDQKEDAERHIRLVDASLGVIAKKLRADEVRVSVRDIPVLLECRERLVRVVSGAIESANGKVIETARVQYAKEVGGDLIVAMHEDAVELVAILGALKTSRDADKDSMNERDEEVRDTSAV